MAEYNWEKFIRKAHIQSPIETVFNSWVKPSMITNWFIKEATYTSAEGIVRKDNETPQRGDKYHWLWHQNLQSQGEVLEVKENEIFKFTFGKKESGSDENVVLV